MRSKADREDGFRLSDVLFIVGDYLNGALIGALTAVAVKTLVGPETDMVLAMLMGMGVGMVVHIAIGLFATPVLGMFHAMVPGSLIGMYGGMMFAMRDSMQAHAASSFAHAAIVGAIFGLAVIAAVQLYNRAVCGPVVTRVAGVGRGE
jgi:hypothetical protein